MTTGSLPQPQADAERAVLYARIPRELKDQIVAISASEERDIGVVVTRLLRAALTQASTTDQASE
jgi:hypothetical protein